MTARDGWAGREKDGGLWGNRDTSYIGERLTCRAACEALEGNLWKGASARCASARCTSGKALL